MIIAIIVITSVITIIAITRVILLTVINSVIFTIISIITITIDYMGFTPGTQSMPQVLNPHSRYPIHTGFHNGVIEPKTPYGLDTSFTTLAQVRHNHQTLVRDACPHQKGRIFGKLPGGGVTPIRIISLQILAQKLERKFEN